MIWPARVLGGLTAIYSVFVLVRPMILARPTGLAETDADLTPGLRLLCRGIGVRDLATGLAVVLVPGGVALYTALALRIAADLGDAALFGTAAPDRSARIEVIAVTVGWAAVTALTWYLAAR